MRDDGEVHALDTRAKREVTKHPSQHPGHQHDHQQRGQKAVAEGPMPRQGFPVKEHHEIGQVAFVVAIGANLAHQVHAHHIAAERKKQTVAERQDAGVAPDQIHGEGTDGVAQDLAHQCDCVVAHVEQAACRHPKVEHGHHRAHGDERGQEQNPALGAQQHGGLWQFE